MNYMETVTWYMSVGTPFRPRSEMFYEVGILCQSFKLFCQIRDWQQYIGLGTFICSSTVPSLVGVPLLGPWGIMVLHMTRFRKIAHFINWFPVKKKKLNKKFLCIRNSAKWGSVNEWFYLSVCPWGPHGCAAGYSQDTGTPWIILKQEREEKQTRTIHKLHVEQRICNQWW